MAIQPSLAMLKARPVLEELELAELPPTCGELLEVWDRSTGLRLDPAMVQTARREENDFMSPFVVTTPSSLEVCREQTGLT